MNDATTHINEFTVTQPYAAGRCWFQLTKGARGYKHSAPKFCEATYGVLEYWVTKPAEHAKLRSTCSVKMFVCELHVKSLKRSGYEVTKVVAP
jgi:hypothetical protein